MARDPKAPEPDEPIPYALTPLAVEWLVRCSELLDRKRDAERHEPESSDAA